MKAFEPLHYARCNLSPVEADLKFGAWKALFEREFVDDPDFIVNEPKFFFLYKQTFLVPKPIASAVALA